MNNIIYKYLLKNFIKNFFIVFSIFYFFGLILNLFEEIEFFKNLQVSFLMPLILTSIYIPSLLIQILPFIIFISSLIFMVKIRNNKDLLTLKVFGYSNYKVFLILASSSFIFGWIILFMINPLTSSMAKYYEMSKSKYSRDIDHLINFTKNGLWIKENLNNTQRIISAEKPDGKKLINLKIFHLDENSNLIEKITSKEANIETNSWVLKKVLINKLDGDILVPKQLEEYRITSNYNYEKINNLFKNFDTMSFLDLLMNQSELKKKGYNPAHLSQNLHTMLSLPFFLFLMTGISAIMTMGTLKKSDSLKISFFGLLIVVVIFYFKDLSLALGQTNRIPLVLAVWSPIIALSMFTFVGLIQINEK